MSGWRRWGVFLLAVCVNQHAFSHEGHAQHRPGEAEATSQGGAAVEEAVRYFQLFTALVAQWPLRLKDELIAQAAREHQLVHGDTLALSLDDLRLRRSETLGQLQSLLPTIRVQLTPHRTKLVKPKALLTLCRGIESPILWHVTNQTGQDLSIRVKPVTPGVVWPDHHQAKYVRIPTGSEMVLLCPLRIEREKTEKASIKQLGLQLESPGNSPARSLSIPVRVTEPAVLKVTLQDQGDPVPCRVIVQCSDGICRLGGKFADKSTFTDKPIIYPAIGTWQKLPFFYSDGHSEVQVPPGPSSVTMERGFEHSPESVDIILRSGETRELTLSCERIADMAAERWFSGDTHVHWVTNAWNVDEPLELLSMVQRAEDLRVANNLTLLQRSGNQAFIKPSQSFMGAVAAHSNEQFHIQMGEEYRNEDLYGHLCFLNIDWLVQPIGTGSIIAGADALDYPINRTAIDSCREQGGISIEAHGTGGNKDVPVNVVHHLADSLDQMEPEMYYRLLDCGFSLPITNGSDHPARPLGIARAYVKVEGTFSYDRWIEGIRRGRTFTTSGPLLFLSVNDAEIGDVIDTGPTDQLRVKAKAISRFPIGEFQIVSNGKVIAAKTIRGTSAEIELCIHAKESRWIVARCSHRTDGRPDWGFGNFNAITGSGIAHTSPVYVHVDGMPRFDPAAADYWAGRMRTHAKDIRARGRFANEGQRDEAVGYIEQGIEMYLQLDRQVHSARSRTETLSEERTRLANVIRRFGSSAAVASALESLDAVSSLAELRDAVEPLVLLSASVNPESRVKIAATRSRIVLRKGRPQRFLVSIENTAGVTAPLEIQAVDVADQPPHRATWCDVRVVDSPFTSVFLTGAEREYKVVELLVRENGLKEVRLTANVGQGTQDLGFRATADLLIDTYSRLPVTEE